MANQYFHMRSFPSYEKEVWKRIVKTYGYESLTQFVHRAMIDKLKEHRSER